MVNFRSFQCEFSYGNAPNRISDNLNFKIPLGYAPVPLAYLEPDQLWTASAGPDTNYDTLKYTKLCVAGKSQPAF